jgi:hypothetical protein
MRPRAIISAVAVAATSLAGLGWSATAAPAASASKVCTWGGTPSAPTGTLTISPGITNVPSPGPLKFGATGDLAGDPGCAGTMTFVGQIDAGSSCAVVSFEGIVKGVPGVARFWGKGSLAVHEFLYDSAGNVVGADQPQIVTQGNSSHFNDCNTPQGFTGGGFSSIVELYR